jgi:hypothetical protein
LPLNAAENFVHLKGWVFTRFAIQSLMDFLTAIETLPPQDALPLLQERYRHNLAFFSQTLPHLAAILQRPTTRYHLYLDSRGINVATQNGELLYPVSNGRSSLFDASRLWAHDLLNNKAASKYFNQKGVSPMMNRRSPSQPGSSTVSSKRPGPVPRSTTTASTSAPARCCPQPSISA